MFGISPPGWIHTLGSLPAIPAAFYMLGRYGRIVPWSSAGIVYLASMLIGATTVFLVAHQPVSNGIGIATLVCLLVGYGVGQFRRFGRPAMYIETIFLSVTVFLLMVPAVSETLRRVPDGHPLVTDPRSPVLLSVQAALFVSLIVGLGLQMIFIRRRS